MIKKCITPSGNWILPFDVYDELIHETCWAPSSEISMQQLSKTALWKDKVPLLQTEGGAQFESRVEKGWKVVQLQDCYCVDFFNLISMLKKVKNSYWLTI